MAKKYDVGIYGVWPGCNYGSIATYYALNKVIEEMGKSVLMIDKPILKQNDVEHGDTHSRRFARRHYSISKQYKLEELGELNDLCDAFVMGSDQVWNYGISKHFGKSFYLDFAADDKTKVAYAVSFGHAKDFAPDDERERISKFMQRFDAIAVREDTGTKLCEKHYSVEARQVLDPVFLLDKQAYLDLAEESDAREDEKYLVTYILDPTPEKREAILHAAEALGGLKVINLLDGLPWNFKRNKEAMGLPNCIENVEIYEWLYYLSNSEFVITDSCHGASFALIFEKPFIAIGNAARGLNRFQSLARTFDVEDRLVTDPKAILTLEELLKPIDYKPILTKMSKLRVENKQWLRRALNSPHQPIRALKKAQRTPDDQLSQDFRRQRMLVTLLRDYGVKHVVLSSGSRNLDMTRLFENNSCFETYSIIDERSAAFFAIGIAQKVKEPVVICCTSGTAAANYWSAVAEAYYQGIPLIVITADRYPAYLGQNENQMIPQPGMFDSVTKMSVTLPVASGMLGGWEARRMICEAILEATHNGNGPVHINVPVLDIHRLPRPRVDLELREHFRKIERITLADSDIKWHKRIERLAIMKKILVIYGQSGPVDSDEQKYIDAFAHKFNAVIAVDHMSNFHSANAVLTRNILMGINQQRYNEEFAPDIVITVGNRRMDDGSIAKLRAQKPPLGHWRIAEDGSIADTYRRLSRVFECSPKEFFRRFSQSNVPYKHDDAYLQRWKAAEKELAQKMPDKFGQHYAVAKALQSVPPLSNVHYGMGTTIRVANRYEIDSSVEVFANLGTNGIDGNTSTFMGTVAVSDELTFLFVSDLSFFYDMNAIWSKELKNNIRIMMVNNNGTSLLKHHGSPSVTHEHGTEARGWVESVGFGYMSARNKQEFDSQVERFCSESNLPLFFEVFV